MFNKQENNDILKDVEAVVGPSVRVKGKFNCEGNVIIEGELNGSVKSGGFLLVGDQAKITANVEANEARIGGLIEGGVKIRGILHLTGTANIIGDIECDRLIVEEGALMNGRCSMASGLNETKPVKKGLRGRKSKQVMRKKVEEANEEMKT